jgi:5-deoxy-D-glucuronate isomerase
VVATEVATEVAEVVATEVAEVVATEVTAEPTAINTVIAVAYGADGEVLSHEQTVEAIANRQGWFDRQGRWVNYARMMKEARAMVASK